MARRNSQWTSSLCFKSSFRSENGGEGKAGGELKLEGRKGDRIGKGKVPLKFHTEASIFLLLIFNFVGFFLFYLSE